MTTEGGGESRRTKGPHQQQTARAEEQKEHTQQHGRLAEESVFPVKDSKKRNGLKSVFEVHEIEDEVTGVQVDRLPNSDRTQAKMEENDAHALRGVVTVNFDARGSRLANELVRRDFVTRES